MNFSRLVILVLILLQTACSGMRTAERDTTPVRKGIEQRLLAMQCWNLTGKIGIRTPEDAHSIWMEWVQNGPSYQMRLSGPLGVGGAEIRGDPGRVEMRLSDEQVLIGDTPEALVEQAFGWRLPLSSLVYWVRGVRAPGAADRQRLNDRNLLAELNQHGWHLSFLAYTPLHSNSPQLPEKVRLSHQDVKVTVIIKDWNPDECS